MKLVLLRCAICDNWYRPDAHHHHCPVCAAHPFTIDGKRKYFHLLEHKAVELVRGVKRVIPLINVQ
jgi:Zn finger protein HypA/HybF involved in hydrogenase expression